MQNQTAASTAIFSFNDFNENGRSCVRNSMAIWPTGSSHWFVLVILSSFNEIARSMRSLFSSCVLRAVMKSLGGRNWIELIETTHPTTEWADNGNKSKWEKQKRFEVSALRSRPDERCKQIQKYLSWRSASLTMMVMMEEEEERKKHKILKSVSL